MMGRGSANDPLARHAMNLRRKWGHFAALSSAEARLFFRACWMLVLVDLELRLRPWQCSYERLAAWAAQHRASGGPPPARLAWLVARAARNVPWPATCLRRSLVLWALLARAGEPAELRVGFQREHETFKAHAWVEHQGRVLNDSPDVRERYAAPADPLVGPAATTPGKPG